MREKADFVSDGIHSSGDSSSDGSVRIFGDGLWKEERRCLRKKGHRSGNEGANFEEEGVQMSSEREAGRESMRM